ncbi:MAG: response regulator transcription factor [Polyangiales bacterium]
MAEKIQARVLVVEDEAPIREGLEDLFGQSGFDVETSADGEDALARLTLGSFDLVLLDLMIPGLTGLEVLRRLRGAEDETPVLVLTAKGEEDDVVAGIEAGADDYVTKPFGIRELVARARGLLRRPRSGARPQVTLGDARIDFEGLRVHHGKSEVVLTSREAFLLQYLMANGQRAVPREELLVEVWGYTDGSVRTRTVDVHVQQLRAKLKRVPGAESWIVTVRGRGYRFSGAE